MNGLYIFWPFFIPQSITATSNTRPDALNCVFLIQSLNIGYKLVKVNSLNISIITEINILQQGLTGIMFIQRAKLDGFGIMFSRTVGAYLIGDA